MLLQFSNFLNSLIVNKTRKVWSLCGYTSFSSPDTQSWDADKGTQHIPTLPLQGPWQQPPVLCWGPGVWLGGSVNTPRNSALGKWPTVLWWRQWVSPEGTANTESCRIWFALTTELWKCVRLKVGFFGGQCNAALKHSCPISHGHQRALCSGLWQHTAPFQQGSFSS